MKVEIKGKNVQLLAETVISLKQFHGTVHVIMDKEKLVLRARNSLNGRSVQHIFKEYFFSVRDKCDVTCDLSVTISDLVESFESMGAIHGESDHCVLESADNKIIINFECENDHVQITLYQAAVNPVWKLESDLNVLDDKDHVSEDDDTPSIEDLINDAEANNLPYHIIKTMKEYKKNAEDVIVID